jgi:endoglucanase
MKKESVDFLRKLLNTPTPSGYETPGQRLFASELVKIADETIDDAMGNVAILANPSRDSKMKVMLAAHCDEVAYMVKYIDDDGTIRVGCIGAPRLCCASGVKVSILHNGNVVPGVMMRKRDSSLTDQEASGKLDVKDFWLDIGANDRSEAEKIVSIGDVVVLDSNFFELNEKYLVAKAFDDKIGVFIISEVLKRVDKEKLKAKLYGVATVQEETGGRGAQLVAHNISPDISIAIDVTDSSDSPEIDEKTTGRIKLGGGPVLLRGCNITPAIGEKLISLAQENGIPHQIEAAPMPTWTDADPLQRIGGGSATALGKIPLRYMHSPTEMISMDDVENSIKLLVAFLHSADETILNKR